VEHVGVGGGILSREHVGEAVSCVLEGASSWWEPLSSGSHLWTVEEVRWRPTGEGVQMGSIMSRALMMEWAMSCMGKCGGEVGSCASGLLCACVLQGCLGQLPVPMREPPSGRSSLGHRGRGRGAILQMHSFGGVVS
jgi:hypothetical protein